ncbi:MAG: ribosome-associated translation inhibitor RaiA [Clostridiales bacterium]|nr:ribosome-associated translation inhibitor RaiA [Clostridiales bacterium]
MKTTIYGKNMAITPAITKRVVTKTNKMERYFKDDVEMIVRMKKEGTNQRKVEITVPFEGALLRAEASNPDNLYLSIDQALGKIERQIHKHRTKLGKRIKEDAFAPTEPEFIEATILEEDQKRQVVRTKQFPVRPMSVEDAAMQMEMLGHSFFAFVNIDSEQINVLYLRKDGNLGLLVPEV